MKLPELTWSDRSGGAGPTAEVSGLVDNCAAEVMVSDECGHAFTLPLTPGKHTLLIEVDKEGNVHVDQGFHPPA